VKPGATLASRLSAWRPPGDAVGIVALGQSGFGLVSEDVRVLIDPFISPRPDRIAAAAVDPRDLVGVTAVLATHEHADHLDLPAWAVIAAMSPAAVFVVPDPLVTPVSGSGVPGDRVIGARIGSPIRLGAARATPVPARHAVHVDDGYSLGEDGDDGPRWVGYVVELGGVRVYHAGDTLAHERIVGSVRPLAPDVALLPINGRDAERERRDIVGNLTPDEAACLARDMSVQLAVPMHFDAIQGNTGRPEAFVRAMRRRHPSASVWVPGVGDGIIWPAGGASLPAPGS